MQRINKHHLFISAATLLLVVLLSLPAIYSLAKPGFFATHDGEWMIIRFSAFYDALREGQFPVRWLDRLNNMYGYPAPNFAYPLFMYLGVPIHVLGFGVVNTVKIVTGAAFIFSGIFTYFWLRKFFRPEAAIGGALLYVYTPYHLYDLYTRGSIGEIVALAILPFVLWQVERKSAFFIPIGTAALLLSHNILALFFFPIIIIYAILRSEHMANKPVLLIRELIPFLLGFGLSLFFWLPAVYDLQYIIFEKAKLADIANNFVGLQLFGIVNLAVLAIASLYLFGRIQKKGRVLFAKSEFRICILFVLIGWIVFLLTNQVSAVIWKVLPATIIQYPFRLLAFLPMVCAFLAAYCIGISKKMRVALLFVFVGACLVAAVPYLSPKEYFDRGDAYYENNFATTTVSNEYTPRWVEKQIFSIPDQKVMTSEGEIAGLISTSKQTDFTLTTTGSAKVTINTTYFPGWKIYNNAKIVPISYTNTHGVMEFEVPGGRNVVSAQFTETPLRLTADMLSLFSFILLLAWTIYTGRKKK